MSATERLRNVEDFSQLLDRHDTWLFDCDGVLWRESTPIEGSVEFLRFLRAKGKRVIFVTNSPSLSRRSLQEKFHGFGIQADIDEIFSSAYSAAVYTGSILLPDKKVYLIGPPGAAEELQEQNINYIGGDDPADHTLAPFDFDSFEHDHSVGAVLCCVDRAINYTKISKAYRFLTKNPGCVFLASDGDATWPAPEGIMLGSGAISALISYALGGIQPTTLGKPSQVMLDCIMSKHDIDASRTIMIGDRLDSDIKFGIQGQFTTLLVLSGVTRESDLASSTVAPRYVAGSLADFSVIT